MITLKKMSAEDFAQFREYSVRSYADDLADRRHIPPEQALSPAADEFISALPCGPDTADSFLFDICDGGEKSGRIWYG